MALGIYRLKYLKKARIPIILDNIYEYIKNSYTGGSNDMYKPTSNNNELIYSYDVNSLYPYSMLKQMPVAFYNSEHNFYYYTYFEGNILEIFNINNFNIFKPSTKNYEKPHGFFEVEVKSPSFLEHPILQLKYNLNLIKDYLRGNRTISPLGKWKGMYYSEEIYNAKKLGYKFKVIRGYLFDKQDIFSGYISNLYKIKEAYTKDEPLYLISKLLMNSLYGRFGMNPELENYTIIDNDELDTYFSQYIIKNIIHLNSKNLDNNDNNKLLISYLNKNSEDKLNNFTHFNGKSKKIPNISVPIAAAITANARIFMSQFKNDPNLTIYYTDTDSLFTNKPLDSKFIGKELGKFKLEYIFKDAVFLGPKIYGGITTENKEIIKIKGYKNKVPFTDLISLLNKSSTLDLNQNKWFKSIENGNITVKEQIYSLTLTENKRELIFDNNKLIGTKPFKLNK